MTRWRALCRDKLTWSFTLLVLMVVSLPTLSPLFHWLFPTLQRPMYEQESFVSLLLAHLVIVGLSGSVSVLVGMAVGIFATRPAGREFRPILETLVAMGQAFPPVAVLAIAVPIIGFGLTPALIALALYGLLPVVQSTIAGIEAVPSAVRDAAEGLGLSHRTRLWRIELPLAAPIIVAGVRTSVVINIGTAALASTVGIPSLGSPIIIGLNGFNTAYIVQGALLVGLLALVADGLFDHLQHRLSRWQSPDVSSTTTKR